MTDGWFCFQRDGGPERPKSFQSAQLDSLFLENGSIGFNAAWCISARDKRLIFFWGDRERYNAPSVSQGRFGYCVRKFGPFLSSSVPPVECCWLIRYLMQHRRTQLSTSVSIQSTKTSASMCMLVGVS